MTNLIYWLFLFTAAFVQPAPYDDICPGDGLLPRTADFQPGGIILTTWDRNAMWVYDIRRNTRYPIENTHPCGTNCHLSPDARSITYRDEELDAMAMMWLDGTNRRELVNRATEVSWWSEDRLLVWSERNRPYLLSLSDGEIERFETPALVNIQPGGYWGVAVSLDDDGEFVRRLVHLRDQRPTVDLGLDEDYFNGMAWSPDGQYLAFVRRAENDDAFRRGAEIYFVSPAGVVVTLPTRMTDFTATYGAVRINGRTPGGLSWSPDSRYLAFWVIPRTGPDIETDTGPAQLHILEADTGHIRVYCDYATTRHTPNPPRLVWSPDSRAIAFGGENTATGFGTMLIAVDVATGAFTALSPDVTAALGNPDVIAWGLYP